MVDIQGISYEFVYRKCHDIGNILLGTQREYNEVKLDKSNFVFGISIKGTDVNLVPGEFKFSGSTHWAEIPPPEGYGYNFIRQGMATVKNVVVNDILRDFMLKNVLNNVIKNVMDPMLEVIFKKLLLTS